MLEFKLLKPNNRVCYNDAAVIAYNLLKYGVEKVRVHTQFICGNETPEHVSIWPNNICCEPEIKVIYEGKETPLLWALLKHFKIRYSGGAGEKYMQAGWHKNSFERYTKHDPYKFGSDITLLFQAMKDAV